MSGNGGGVNSIIIHGVIRPVPVTGQTYAKPTSSAPILIGDKGGIVVEGITPNVPEGSVTVSDVTVTDAGQTLLSVNKNRSSNTFQNNSGNNVYLAFDAAAVAGAGLTLYPYMAWEPNIVFNGEVTAVCDAGLTARVTVLES